MVIRKTCLYKYKMNKVKHYPILSQTCIHFSVQTTPVQFNWSISKTCSWFTHFLLLLSVPYTSNIFMPPFEKGGAYCFAHVGRYVGMSVGMSVGRYVGSP